MKRLYYGFIFGSRLDTKCGSPNPYTGMHSIYGLEYLFKTKKELEDWISEERWESWRQGSGQRIKVNKKQLRNLCLGMTKKEFEEMINEKIKEMEDE